MLTQPAGGAAAERPVTASSYFARLREFACSEGVTPESRAAVTDSLRGPVSDLARACQLALDALDGPDPEIAILYLTDAAATCGQAFSALDAKLP